MEVEKDLGTYELASQPQSSEKYCNKQSKNLKVSTGQPKRFVRDSLQITLYQFNLLLKQAIGLLNRRQVGKIICVNLQKVF